MTQLNDLFNPAVVGEPTTDFRRGEEAARFQMLSELVFQAEQYLNRRSGSAWSRKFLYGFIDQLERQWTDGIDRHQVDGGLGI